MSLNDNIDVEAETDLPPRGPYIPFPAEMAEHLENLYAELAIVIDILRKNNDLTK